MAGTRRALLAVSGYVFAATAASSLGACAGATRRLSGGRGPSAALLAPLTGEFADLGRSMERAGRLAQPAEGDSAGSLLVLDSAGTGGAAAAAAQAVSRGAPLILGPLFAREVPAVVAAARGRPVIAFTNDAAAAGPVAFLLGVTASQSVSAVLRYARGRGVRRVALVAGPESWGRQAAAAAQVAAASSGLTVTEVTFDSDARPPLLDRLRAAFGGEPPDAVLLADARPALLDSARLLGAAGVQVLGTSQWADQPAAALGALEAAWLAAPSPAAFGEFAQSYRARHQVPPGAIAALAYDAVGIARALNAANRATRAGLLEPSGFTAVTGPLRFQADGRCVREMTILVPSATGELRAVDRLPAA